MEKRVKDLIKYFTEKIAPSKLLDAWGPKTFYSSILSLERVSKVRNKDRRFKGMESAFNSYFIEETNLLNSKQIPSGLWYDELRERMHLDFTHAYMAGAVYGNKEASFNTWMQDDIERCFEEQSAFLASFRDEYDAGKYEESPVKAVWRAGLYALILVGIYRLGWLSQAKEEELFWWRVDMLKEHCADCLEMEAFNPYTKKTLTKIPGMGQTVCGGNCGCWLESSRGIRV